MFKRHMQKELESAAIQYPVVTLMGPRQSGKTTLMQYVFPHKAYVNLEAPDTRELAKTDPRGFLGRFPEGAILDEIQRVPELLSYIQVLVDEKKEKGIYFLTGSHQLELHQAISQSLAGRTALLTLLPLSLRELQESSLSLDVDELLLKGGYPRIYQDQLDPTKAYRNYFQTYVERDLRLLINVKDLSQFERFMRLCAGRIGQLINFASLGNEIGLSSHTVQHWISILEASFIIFKLAPYYENFGKRIVKSQKLYFTDVGLASYLLGIENITQLERDPLRGNLFENLVLIEMVKARLNVGMDPSLYFFRDTHGHEVDFVFQKAKTLIPIEVKSSQTFSKNYLKNLHFFQNLVGKRFQSGFVVYSGKEEQKIGDFKLIHFSKASQIVDSQK
jgi:predicted AAA+ superfamily ATPase